MARLVEGYLDHPLHQQSLFRRPTVMGVKETIKGNHPYSFPHRCLSKDIEPPRCAKIGLRQAQSHLLTI